MNSCKALSAVLFLTSVFIFSISRGAVHEIEAILFLLCAIVVASTGQIITAIKESK